MDVEMIPISQSKEEVVAVGAELAVCRFCETDIYSYLDETDPSNKWFHLRHLSTRCSDMVTHAEPRVPPEPLARSQVNLILDGLDEIDNKLESGRNQLESGRPISEV